jgi:DNA replication and repair protein RecF
MFLEKISLINFRNLEKQEIEFKNTINVVFGDNAQGKTNLLEAIHLLANGKSFRTRIDHELITWGEESAKLTTHVGFLDIDLTIKPNDKELLINSQRKKLVDLIGSFNVVTFTPSDIEIISGSPDKRRKYLDQLGVILDKKYLHDLVSMTKIIKNRNQILWQIKHGHRIDLDIWDQQLVKTATAVWEFRESLVSKINTQLKTVGRRLTGSEVKVAYKTSVEGDDRKHRETKYLTELKSVHEEDISRSSTSIGPHRDDFRVVLDEVKKDKVVSKDLNIYGSRGEQRTAALALKLVEVNIIEDEKKDKPVLLLDEVLSELDNHHRRFLLKETRGLQCFITTTSLENISDKISGQFDKYEVANGKIIAV